MPELPASPETIIFTLVFLLINGKGPLWIDFGLLDYLEDQNFITQPQKGRKGKVPSRVGMTGIGEELAEKLLSAIDTDKLREIYANYQQEGEAMKWGQWELDTKNMCLLHSIEKYEVPLDTIDSSAVIADSIFQVFGKTWTDKETIYDLIHAFEDILKPQANYCSFGKDKQSNGAALVKAFVQKTRHQPSSSNE